MKSRAEVEALKQSWLNDPIYDLWDESGTVDGFEQYESELHAFQDEWKARWQASRLACAETVRRDGSLSAFVRASEHDFAPGLRIREYFAVRFGASLTVEYSDPAECATKAVEYADALLLALSKPPAGT